MSEEGERGKGKEAKRMQGRIEEKRRMGRMTPIENSTNGRKDRRKGRKVEGEEWNRSNILNSIKMMRPRLIIFGKIKEEQGQKGQRKELRKGKNNRKEKTRRNEKEERRQRRRMEEKEMRCGAREKKNGGEKKRKKEKKGEGSSPAMGQGREKKEKANTPKREGRNCEGS